MLREEESPSRSFPSGVIGIYALLVSGTIAAWMSTLVAFRNDVILLSTAFLAFSLGPRHAVDGVDADHIATIDERHANTSVGARRGIKLLLL